MIINITPDRQKSISLVSMAKITLERLSSTDTKKYPTNTLLDYYDAIHNLMEALSSAIGVKIKGEGAHHELIEYLAKERKISEQMRKFLQEMRDYRNRISYEGFRVSQNYIELNKEIIDRIIKHLDAQL